MKQCTENKIPHFSSCISCQSPSPDSGLILSHDSGLDVYTVEGDILDSHCQ